MSDDYDIIEENDDYRVRLEIDPYPEQPWGDMQAPLVRMENRLYQVSAEHVDGSGRPHDMDSYVEAAIERWGTPSSPDWHYVETYLRAFHGTTKIDWYNSGPNGYWYVSYDTAQWREYLGITDLARLHREDFLAEWKAWIEGEAYSYVLERKVHVSQERRLEWAGDSRVESSEYDEWEEIDSCSGFYGYKYACEAALEAFRAATGQEGTTS